MPWVRLEDDWYDDDDLIEAGPAAMLLWPLLITWCARNLKDGKIPAGQIPRLVDWHTLGVDPEQAIAPLVASGRLQSIAGGYLITNYLKFQPSREKVLADRDASRQRAAKSRDRARDVREECAEGAPPPVPPPVPTEPSSSSEQVNPPGFPSDLWMKIAERQAKRTTAQIANPTAWCRKAAQNAKADMHERAVWLWTTYEITESQLADVLVAGGSSPLLNSLRKRDAA